MKEERNINEQGLNKEVKNSYFVGTIPFLSLMINLFHNESERDDTT